MYKKGSNANTERFLPTRRTGQVCETLRNDNVVILCYHKMQVFLPFLLCPKQIRLNPGLES
jgi:hypothetical protein